VSSAARRAHDAALRGAAEHAATRPHIHGEPLDSASIEGAQWGAGVVLAIAQAMHDVPISMLEARAAAGEAILTRVLDAQAHPDLYPPAWIAAAALAAARTAKETRIIP